MKQADIVTRLLEIATYVGEGRSPFICADTIDQEDLYVIQEKLASLLEILDRKRFQAHCPYMYGETKP